MARVYRIQVKRPRPSMQSDDVNFHGARLVRDMGV